jgi:hypothetical protein
MSVSESPFTLVVTIRADSVEPDLDVGLARLEGALLEHVEPPVAAESGTVNPVRRNERSVAVDRQVVLRRRTLTGLRLPHVQRQALELLGGARTARLDPFRSRAPCKTNDALGFGSRP